jgi:hypothetical protein
MAELHRASPCKLERDIENAAFSALTQWIEHDRPPPHAPVIQVDMTTAPRSIVRDALGNAVGGVRMPFVDVPTAT